MKRITFIVLGLLLVLAVAANMALSVWHKNEIKKASPKAASVLAALEKVMELREAEIKIKNKYGKMTHARCIAFHLNELKARMVKSKEKMEEGRDAHVKKCAEYYKELGVEIPGLEVMPNFTLRSAEYSYAVFDENSVSVSELSGGDYMSLDGMAKGYVGLYYLPKAENETQKIEVECGGTEYWKGVCPALSKQLLTLRPGGAEYIILTEPKKVDLPAGVGQKGI